MDGIVNWLKNNWFKIAIYIMAALFLYNIIDDVKSYLRKENSPQTIKVETPQQSTNLNPLGNITVNPPAVSVHVTPATQETGTATVVTKTSKTDPDVIVDDSNTKYVLSYTGMKGTKVYKFDPVTKEDYKFENNSVKFTREASYNLNVSVPQIDWSIGIGRTTDGKVAGTVDYRIPKTTWNVWMYHGGETAYGIKSVHYN